MDRDLVARWNDSVAPDDEVWVLGDVAMGRIDESLAARRTSSPAPSASCPATTTAAGPAAASRRRAGPSATSPPGSPRCSPEQVDLTIGGHAALACHFPYVGDSHDEARFESHRPVDDGRLLLHGHVHTRWRVDGRQVNVGCDVWDYRPVAEDTILAARVGLTPLSVGSTRSVRSACTTTPDTRRRPCWPGRPSMRRSMRSTNGWPPAPP